MALPNIFTKEVSEKIIERINKLHAHTHPLWGKMSAPQMLAHCNVTYEMIYEDKHPKPNFLLKIILKSLVKKNVTDEKPYKQNLRTAPAFLIIGDKDFEEEKNDWWQILEKPKNLAKCIFTIKNRYRLGKCL